MKNITKYNGITMSFKEISMNSQEAFSAPVAATSEKEQPGKHSIFDDTCVLISNADSQQGNSLSLMLSTTKGFFCTGSFINGTELIEKIRLVPPDIVLLDVKLPDMCSVTAVKRIHAEFPDIKILMLTNSDDDEMVFHAICAGASGYILKYHSLETIMLIIHELQQGFLPISPPVLRRVIEAFHLQNTPSEGNPFRLTAREKEVMNLMVDGASYKMIAGKLGIGYDTVHNHIKKIYCKLEVNSMSEAVAKVLKTQINR